MFTIRWTQEEWLRWTEEEWSSEVDGGRVVEVDGDTGNVFREMQEGMWARVFRKNKKDRWSSVNLNDWK